MQSRKEVRRVKKEPIRRMKRDLLEAAKKMDIPVLEFIDGTDYWQFGWGVNSKVFYYSSPFEDGYHGVSISKDKLESKRLLESIGLPIAENKVINSPNEFEKISKEITYPCVVKPVSGSGGTGITANVKNKKDLKFAYEIARSSRFGKKPIIVEKFIEGDDFRLIVAYGKFLAAIKRKLPYVIGNGKSTIKELISENKLTSIKINKKLINHLKILNLTIFSVPITDEKIVLSSTSNIISGGIGEDATHLINPELIKMSEELAKITNIAILGIDYITTDITKPFYETGGAITEFNHYISLSSSSFYDDKNIFFEKIFGETPTRIPIVVIVIERKEQVLVSKYLKENININSLGFLCNQELYIGKRKLNTNSCLFNSLLKILLRQKSLENAIIVCTKEELLEKNLVLDKVDIIYEYSLDNKKLSNYHLNIKCHEFIEFNNLEQLSLNILKIISLNKSKYTL